MTTRTRRESVTFRHAFELRGVDGRLPAGTYAIDTDEELLDSLTLTAYRRVATSLTLPLAAGSYQIVRIDPADLEAARVRDAQRTPAETSSGPRGSTS